MRKLTVKYTYEGNRIFLHVEEQTHRECDLTPEGSRFRASNGWNLESCSCPELRSDERILYLRGGMPRDDDLRCTVGQPEVIFEINQAVREYNEKYGGHRV